MIGYVRRSKANRSRPDDRSHGIDAQRAAIREAATREGWDVVWTPETDDGWTGANTRRPGLTWALAELAAGRADGLVVSKFDRLSRSVLDFARIHETATKQGWRIVVLAVGIDTSTPNGRLLANFLMAVAEWEREIIAERTREALAEARAQGVRLGRPVLVDESTVDFIRAYREAGHKLRAIADALNASGVPTAHGGTAWRPSTLRGVLRRSGGDPQAA